MSSPLPIDDALNDISREVVDASIQLHKALGPGLLETVYTVVLQKKLEERGFEVKREQAIPVEFEGSRFELGFRADLVINDAFIVELKSVEKLAPVHKKQLLTYLRLTGYRLGLLINFNQNFLKDGIVRVIN